MTAAIGARPRVLMAGPDPAGRGGIETVSRLIASHCAEYAEIEVVTTHRDGSLSTRARTAVRATVTVLLRLIRGRVDVLHLHVAKRGSIARKGILALLGRAFGVAVILHCHGGMFASDYRRMPVPLQALVSAVFRSARTVIVLSESWRDVYAELVGVPVDRLAVVMNAVELPTEVPRRARRPLAIAFLGRLGPEKGAWDLVRAISELPAAVKADVRLVMAGDGQVEDTRRLVQQLGLADVVVVRDWLGPGERDALLAGSSVFVLPSYNEGLPMAMLEAMAWGVIPVVSAVGGIPEVVRDGVDGLLVRPGDVSGLAAVLKRLAAEPDTLDALSVAARRRVQARGASTYATHIAGIWRSALVTKREDRLRTVKEDRRP